MAHIDRDVISRLYENGSVSTQEATQFQKQMRDMVASENGFSEIETIAGVDLAYLKSEGKLVCGIIVFSYPELLEKERAYVVRDIDFPYIPGFLAFREGPPIIEAYKKLSNKPDLIMVDGHGQAHPRGFGIACHIGVVLGVPTIGVAKKKLYGECREPGNKKGSMTDIRTKKGELIGNVVRTRDSVKPVFVSVGHLVDLSSASNIALECARGYRVPEPTRIADRYVAELKRGVMDSA